MTELSPVILYLANIKQKDEKTKGKAHLDTSYSFKSQST